MFVICFAVDCVESFESVRWRWLPELQSYHHSTQLQERKDADKILAILVGTRVDTRQSSSKIVVSQRAAIKLAKELGLAAYVECSSLTGQGLQDVFEQAVRVVLFDQKQNKKHKSLLQRTLSIGSFKKKETQRQQDMAAVPSPPTRIMGIREEGTSRSYCGCVPIRKCDTQ